MAKGYRPPIKTGTVLHNDKIEDMKKYSKHTKVKIYTPEEIAEYVENKKQEEEKKSRKYNVDSD